MTRSLIVGLGSSHGDDQAGWLVIDFLLSLGAHEHSVRKAAHPADVLSWARADLSLTICDAGYPHGQPGRVGRWSWPTDTLEASRLCGTHDLPLADVLALGRETGCCTNHVEIWTIEGVAFDAMTAATPAVLESALQVAERIWRRLREPSHA
jgi:hydrogenase maturation protease